MKVLLHTCCSNCTTYVYQRLEDEGLEVTGYFYNPNIHPYLEFKQRLDSLREFAQRVGLGMIYDNEYGLEEFLRQVVYREKERCILCYNMRLRAAAEMAVAQGFDAFTTTLLISPYQKHDLIKQIGESLAKEFGVKFYYEDFRLGYHESINMSKQMKLYRQKYCGCVYSEGERYLKREGR